MRDGIERFARGRLLTVFSAANYCGYRNAGALLLVGRDHVVVPKVVQPSLRPAPAPQAASVATAGTAAGAAGWDFQVTAPVQMGAARAVPAGKPAAGEAGQEAVAAAVKIAGRCGSEDGELAAAAGLGVAQVQAVYATGAQQAGPARVAEAPPASKLPRPGRVLVAVAAEGGPSGATLGRTSNAAASCGGTLLECLGIEGDTSQQQAATAAAVTGDSSSGGGGREVGTCTVKGRPAAHSGLKVHVLATSPAGDHKPAAGSQAEELKLEDPEAKGSKPAGSAPGIGTVLNMCSALAMLAALRLSSP